MYLKVLNIRREINRNRAKEGKIQKIEVMWMKDPKVKGKVLYVLSILLIIAIIIKLFPTSNDEMSKRREAVRESINAEHEVNTIVKETGDIVRKAELMAYLKDENLREQYKQDINFWLEDVKMFEEGDYAHFPIYQEDEDIAFSDRLRKVANIVGNLVSSDKYGDYAVNKIVLELEEQYNHLDGMFGIVTVKDGMGAEDGVNALHDVASTMLDKTLIMIMVLLLIQIYIGFIFKDHIK